MTAGTDPHSLLVALIGDIIRTGLDAARVHLPPRVERQIIETAAEALELAGYELVLPHDRCTSASLEVLPDAMDTGL